MHGILSAGMNSHCYDEAVFIEDSETVVIHEMKSGYTNRHPVSDVYYQ